VRRTLDGIPLGWVREIPEEIRRETAPATVRAASAVLPSTTDRAAAPVTTAR
jgi:hypothetical protein